MEATENRANGAGQTPSGDKKKGCASISVTMMGISAAACGCSANLILFFIREFNMGSITATLINYCTLTCYNFFAFAGFMVADSCFRSTSFRFSLVTIFSFISLLGTIMLTLIPAVQSLTPPPYESPSRYQYGVLYLALALVSLGFGGTRFGFLHMTACQYGKMVDFMVFTNFNYFFAVVIFGAVIYFDDNVSWSLGFGICVVANAIALIVFLFGKRKGLYCQNEPQWKISLSENSQGQDDTTEVQASALTKSFSMLTSLTTVQALTMDRSIDLPYFKNVPPESYQFMNLAISPFLALLCQLSKLLAYPYNTGQTLTPLQRIGIGRVFNIIAIVASALIESRRLHIVRTHDLTNKPGSVVPMTSSWLVVPQLLLGFAHSFHLLAQAEACSSQVFPRSYIIHEVMIILSYGIGNYLSATITVLVSLLTGWLSNNINDGRLDYVFWMLAMIGVVNFGYYLVSAKRYKFQQHNDEASSDKKIENKTAKKIVKCKDTKPEAKVVTEA
ncbi:transporter, putative [Ricinus communis]|uniref:Transporter, putative n=1 Tax=Ricinus communis TaxID=3988 RepID=B9SR32_RICCO|nr:transporter, putative [Ricinus communis]